MDTVDTSTRLDDLSLEELEHELSIRAKAAAGSARAVALGANEALQAVTTAAIVAEVHNRQKVIYGTDDRLELFAVQDQALVQDADSVVCIVEVANIRDNGDGTSTLGGPRFATAFGLCPSEPFGDQPSVSWCSGFLVAPDTVATAGHCLDAATLDDYRFVFGFRMQNAGAAQLTVSNQEVYRGVSLIGWRLENGARGQTDWALVRLDRAVTNHRVARPRVAGAVPQGEPVHVIGHPCGLPIKVAGGAGVRDNAPAPFFVANLDTYGGNSGSPVFNSRTHEIEGILVRGETDFVSMGTCNVSNVCPDTGCGGEAVTRASEFSAYLPGGGATSGGYLIQSRFGPLGNFEVVVPRASSGLVHFWRDNHVPSLPWHGPGDVGGADRYEATSLIQSNFGNPGNLEVVARTGNRLTHFWRESAPPFTWHGPFVFATGVAGSPGFIQGRFGPIGNFEVVAPRAGGGLTHVWRDNHDPGLPWHESPSFGGNDRYEAVALIQGSFGTPGNLEVVARSGDRLAHFWREAAPPFTWHGPFFFAAGAAGTPSLIQGRFGPRGNFEVVVPRAGGGLLHFWRDNHDPGLPWHGPGSFGGNDHFATAALIQGNFGFPGNLEVVARSGNRLVHLWREGAPPFTWHGPFFFGSA